ncbi:MAG: bifunctional metallophosphatase/5'-nucleotidase [Deltaproteobacteria bacterium]|nr:bifunctional metallophosphatase/5'-nucleotidase [Deltaproteobacteria bacterium]
MLVHEGGAATGLYNECAGISGSPFEIVKGLDEAIDVVVAGHTNAAHVCDIDGRIVTSGNVIVTRDVQKDAAQTRILEKWKALVAPIANRVVATIGQDLTKTPNASGESVLGDVIADAQLAASPGARIAFMNPGGIRTDLLVAQVSGGEKAGEVTYTELFAVQPFSNNLVLFDLTGAQIERVLEEQWFDFAKGADRGTKSAVLQVSAGFAYVVQPTRAAGDRVDPTTITLDGQPIDPAATYRVVANVFLAGGGDGFPTLCAGINRVSGVFDLEALERHLVGQPGLIPSGAGRIRVATPPRDTQCLGG